MNQSLPQNTGEKSLWGETAIPAPASGNLTNSLTADVLVIGAGYTGLSTALHLAEKGVSVIVLEAKNIGFGGSGRNAGLVNAGVWQNPDHVEKILGKDVGQRFNLALYDSPSLVFDLVKRFKMDCQASRCGTVNIAHNESGFRHLEKRCQQLISLGAAVELINGETSREISRSPAYRYGGLLDPLAGTIQPLSYTRSLAIAAINAGTQIFQQSPVIALNRENDNWQAKTAKGRVTAKQIVMATNAYSEGDNLKVADSIVPTQIFQCATNPLPEAIAAAIIPQRQGLWDTRLLLTSSRVDHQGRLVMSSPGSLSGWDKAIRVNWMTRLRDKLYPQVKGIPWAFHWTGQIGTTSTKILRIQLVAPGVYAPSGFNGRGIGVGTVIGKHLAETLVSGDLDTLPFPVEDLYQEKWRLSRSSYLKLGTLALQFIDKRL
ncbi:MAG: glycine/D-amino acid oxidase-like deaminating enzyme [Gammaproteobacteria bacterium]|jgi:glycine/D-amino acid oxidase-like deaminating enzyme